MYYAFLTNPHFFTLEAFHQKGHAFYQFVTYLVREITSNAGSDGVVFVSLFTAALKRVPSAIRYYTHELASLAMMSESRDEVAVNRTPVEEYVRVVVLHARRGARAASPGGDGRAAGAESEGPVGRETHPEQRGQRSASALLAVLVRAGEEPTCRGV